MTIAIVVEGDTDLPVARKMASSVGLRSTLEIDCGGKGQLDSALGGYNDSAKGSPWFVLRDLNSDAECPAEYLRRIRFTPSTWMCFRLAVRELESWLLADRTGFAEFFQVPLHRLPNDPDAESDPTETIVNLCRRSGSSRIRSSMLPRPGAHVAVGPLYEATIIEFGEKRWSVTRAARSSDSVRRARRAIRALATSWNRHIRA